MSQLEPPFVLRWMRANTVPAAEPPRPSWRTRAQTRAEPTPAGTATVLLVGLKASRVSTASAFQTTREGHWQVQVLEKLQGLRPNGKGEIAWDQAALLNAMDRFWSEAFRMVLGRAERAIVNELVDVRNKLSHNEPFTYDDAERALDSMRRLMEAISAGEVADQLAKARDTILRTKFTELQRNEERRKTARFDISVDPPYQYPR